MSIIDFQQMQPMPILRNNRSLVAGGRSKSFFPVFSTLFTHSPLDISIVSGPTLNPPVRPSMPSAVPPQPVQSRQTPHTSYFAQPNPVTNAPTAVRGMQPFAVHCSWEQSKAKTQCLAFFQEILREEQHRHDLWTISSSKWMSGLLKSS